MPKPPSKTTAKVPAKKTTARPATSTRKPAAKKTATAKKAPATPARKPRKTAAKAPPIQAVPDGSVACARCGTPFKPRQRNQRFHSEECRKAAGKNRSKGKPEQLADVVDLPPQTESTGEGKYIPGAGGQTPTYDRTYKTLERAGRLDTFEGGLALDAALRIDNSVGVTGIPPMLAKLQELVSEAVKDAEQSDDTVDNIRASALRLLGNA